MSIKSKYDKHGIEIYEGDNLEVLSYTPKGTLNLIYCDILYNSGKSFYDYNDNLGSPTEAMEWYRPRIEAMHRALASNGSIYIHCNWRMDSYMRLLLDEIFGVENFRNRIYRQHSKTRGFVENFDSQMDIILYYVKDKNNFVFNEIKGPKLRTVALFENGNLAGRSFEFKRGTMRFRGMTKDKHFLVSRKQLEELQDKGELVAIDGLPYRQTYAEPMGNLWNEDNMLDKYSRIDTAETYDTPKPLELIEKIIKISSNEGDKVGDFFLGGGTTAVAALKLGRKGLFCDISEKACNVTVKKLNDLLRGDDIDYHDWLLEELKGMLTEAEEKKADKHNSDRDNGYFSGQVNTLEDLIYKIENQNKTTLDLGEGNITKEIMQRVLKEVFIPDFTAAFAYDYKLPSEVGNMLLSNIRKSPGAPWNCFSHKDTHPSMQVYTETNSTHCFGCEENNSVISLHRQLMKMVTGKDITEEESVEYLYNRFLKDGKGTLKIGEVEIEYDMNKLLNKVTMWKYNPEKHKNVTEAQYYNHKRKLIDKIIRFKDEDTLRKALEKIHFNKNGDISNNKRNIITRFTVKRNYGTATSISKYTVDAIMVKKVSDFKGKIVLESCLICK